MHIKKMIFLVLSLILFLLALPQTGTVFASAPADHYLFAYFKSPSFSDSQQLHFAVSADGLHYHELNQGQPIIKVPTYVRDPFILRRQDNTCFNILATSRDPSKQTDPKRTIIVMSSGDLLNWDYQFKQIGTPDTQHTWAPEAIWDPSANNYLVIWAQSTQASQEKDMGIFACRTTDFNHFTTPAPYMSDGHNNTIDPDIVQNNGQYYRFFKDETNKRVYADKVSQLNINQGTLIPSVTLATLTNVEGPEAYQLYGKSQWVLLLDHYTQNGYAPLVTDNLDQGTYQTPASYQLPAGARHGSVLAITAQEYQKLLQKWH